MKKSIFNELIFSALRGNYSALSRLEEYGKENYGVEMGFLEHEKERACKEIEKALAQNPEDSNALTLKGFMHYISYLNDKKNNKENEEELANAMTLLTRACQLDNSNAMVYLIQLNRIRTRREQHVTWSLEYDSLEVNYFMRACQLNNPEALHRFGAISRAEWSTEQNFEAEIKNRNAAADLGHTKALIGLAVCYEHGSWYRRRYSDHQQRAMQCLNRACELGDSDAMIAIANQYLSGRLVRRNISQVINYLARAMELNNYKAYCRQAELILEGVIERYDLDRVCQLYYQSYCIQQNNSALFRLQYLWKEYKWPPALQAWLLIAISSNNLAKAKEIYSSYPDILKKLYYPLDEPFLKPLLAFLQQQPVPDYHLINYLQFRHLLNKHKDKEAFTYYEKYLLTDNYAEASELFRMANMQLFDFEPTNLNQQPFEGPKKACLLLLRGYLKERNRDCYSLLISLLSTILATSEGRNLASYNTREHNQLITQLKNRIDTLLADYNIAIQKLRNLDDQLPQVPVKHDYKDIPCCFFRRFSKEIHTTAQITVQLTEALSKPNLLTSLITKWEHTLRTSPYSAIFWPVIAFANHINELFLPPVPSMVSSLSLPCS
ncbi:tetratricopeptide repeat protein [Legionella dresdenensis]|uniref:Tetratricopeptide repeat protein n=1 Tax=Legionella dresdenensis TaxID=450200 RepID=A0ABV8CB75_9GAMM